jgi:heavy metal sensor kinase
MMTSLRNRLILGIVGGMVLLLTIFSLLIYVVIHSALVKQFDSSLASVAQVLAASVELDGNEIEFEFTVQQMPEFLNTEHPTHYQLWDANGKVIAKSPLLGTDNLLRLKGPLNVLVYGTPQDKHDQPQRAVGLTFIPRLADSHDEDEGKHGTDRDGKVQDSLQKANNQSLTLVVARDAGDLYGQLNFLLWLLFTASAVTIALSVLIAAFIVRRGLRPLHSIASEIAAVREDDLATRIGTALVPAEILPIKNRLNDLLSRLEEAFKRERRFTADVAHELRNPLAGIRSTIEVNLTRTRDITEYKSALSDCLEIVDKMQNMVNNLLLLARLDAQQVSLQSEQIRLAELVDSCWRPFSDKAKDNKITFDNSIDPEITLESDRHNLSTILSNVLENAVEYAEKGGQIQTTVHLEEDSLQITVSNTGCQLTPEQAARVFDRFWRGDPSRKDAGVHCGLGLALVERIVKALGGKTTTEVETAGIFKIHLFLPFN